MHKLCRRCDEFYNTESKFSKFCPKCYKYNRKTFNFLQGSNLSNANH